MWVAIERCDVGAADDNVDVAVDAAADVHPGAIRVDQVAQDRVAWLQLHSETTVRVLRVGRWVVGNGTTAAQERARRRRGDQGSAGNLACDELDA